MTKKYVALARVSSREQQREGFSLDIQEDALRRYAERMGGTIVKLFRIAETATKQDERRAFKELLAYAKKHAEELTGLLFYKVDRAARNLFDYVELERLESEHGLEFISVSQPTENTPAGRMQRRMLASMASFYTEQQSLDVKEGLARRVKEGWFVGHAPYGYRNVRIDGRGLVEIDQMNAPKVKRIFELFAYHGCTLDMLIERLAAEGIVYRDTMRRFPRSTLHAILHDRAYIGEVEHKGQWYPGKHRPLVDRETWERVQALLGEQVYRTHELTYGSDLITCQCGHKIVGERKIKLTRAGERDYNYYRCSKYSSKGHPRIRLTEADLDAQVLALFAKLRIEDDRGPGLGSARAARPDPRRARLHPRATGGIAPSAYADPGADRPASQPPAVGRDRPRYVRRKEHRATGPGRKAQAASRCPRPWARRKRRHRHQGV